MEQSVYYALVTVTGTVPTSPAATGGSSRGDRRRRPAEVVLAVWADIGSDTLDTDEQIVAGYRDECRFFPRVELADR